MTENASLIRCKEMTWEMLLRKVIPTSLATIEEYLNFVVNQ